MKPTSPARRRLPAQWLWGSAAIAALAVAILVGHGGAGAQRIALVASALDAGSPQPVRGRQTAPPRIDADAAIRQLAQAIRGVAQEQQQITSRMAAVERNLDDMTGSITRQNEAVKAAPAAVAWPAPNTSTPETIAAAMAPPNLPAPATTSVPTPATTPPTGGYGADVGGASSIKTLHARWTVLQAAHPQLFEGLRPGVTVRDNPRSNRLELRLVVGPLPTAEAAAQLCISLAAMRVGCQPTMFDHRLALQ
ncbi:MAG TPA: hypothetical protein VMV19_09165 [Xanthobacteraceae bacterium]|nr:hypothetical protein [Xanthobacteraceae bacterium]